MPTTELGRGAAVAGVGCLPFTKNSGRTELHNALLAIQLAADDAGIGVKEIDGIINHDLDRVVDWQIAAGLGLDHVPFTCTAVHGGGAGCGAIGLAALAVLAGKARYVAVFRSYNGRSDDRYSPALTATRVAGAAAWRAPFGMIAGVQQLALRARRYMIEYGATSRDFGAVAVSFRKHAAVNPDAYFYQRPITIEDHEASPMIVDPLRLLDITSRYDSAGAVIVTTAERARDLRQTPAHVLGWGQSTNGSLDPMTASNRGRMTVLDEVRHASADAYAMAGIGPRDVQVFEVYDHFTPMVLMAIEDMGFCAKGEGFEFVRDGALEVGGRLPTNTHGGNLGEGYIHFMNHIREGVRQIRGTSPNQVPDCEVAALLGGYGVTTSTLILGR